MGTEQRGFTEHPIDFDGLLEEPNFDYSDGMNDFDDLLDAVAYAKSLPEREQKILMLFCEGYTQEEIGAEMGCNQSTVSRVLERVHKKAQ